MKSLNNVFITGGAGFIGSNLADRLISCGKRVTVYDNFSTGKIRFLNNIRNNGNVNIIEGDVLDLVLLKKSLINHDMVFHLSANADVRFGLNETKKDLEQNTIATYNVLEAMQYSNVKNIAFSSTGSIYGEAKIFPTPEDVSFPVQTSLYGASKLASEGLIQSYCEGFNFHSWIFRFVGVLGERYNHGHLYDFYKKLKKNPKELEILGDGKQRKSYIYIQDCIDSMLHAIEHTSKHVNIFNLGCDEYIEVDYSVKLITKYLKCSPKCNYTGGNQGWVGDNPYIYLDTSKIRDLGWTEKVTIKEGILKTIKWLDKNQWVYE